jgi:Domain of unknown function (DUF4266)
VTRSRLVRCVTLGVALISAVLASGCLPVHPWQRGTLVSAPMQDPLNPAESVHDNHVHQTREAMAGAAGAGGVSCGCN